jgi:hypothetical protein
MAGADARDPNARDLNFISRISFVSFASFVVSIRGIATPSVGTSLIFHVALSLPGAIHRGRLLHPASPLARG